MIREAIHHVNSILLILCLISLTLSLPGISIAANFDYINGKRHWYCQAGDGGFRTLPVRSAK